MIIQLDRELEQATTIEELRPILRVLIKALNTVGDAKGQIRGDLVFHDGGVVCRGSDGNYYRQTVGFVSGSPTTVYTFVGKNPTGE